MLLLLLLRFKTKQWELYGDKLLSRLDSQLDAAFQAFSPPSSGMSGSSTIDGNIGDCKLDVSATSAAALSSTSPMLTSMSAESDPKKLHSYWQRLQQMFAASSWYARVDEI